LFARVHELFRQGWTAADISRHLDINRRRIDKWVRLEALPERSPCDPKPTSPLRFHAQLQELMRQGVTKIKWLFAEAKKLAYKGSFGHMARYVAHVRSIVRANGSPAPAEHTIRSLPLDHRLVARLRLPARRRGAPAPVRPGIAACLAMLDGVFGPLLDIITKSLRGGRSSSEPSLHAAQSMTAPQLGSSVWPV
jgi:hypothetical protein